jgi:antitoxin component YwqK of YwqJK toxin-antitoxin module
MRSLIYVAAVLCVAGICFYVAKGEPTRVVQAHFASGGLQAEAEMDSQGKNHGMLRKYYENGTLESEAEFSHGSMSWIRHYHPNGQLAEEQSNGIWSTSRQIYDEQGNPITQH